jgi:8-oxo-dGTP pyrophosphatase MutT (NUDIX family)
MGIHEYEQGLGTPLRQATVMLLMRDDEVLLAMKKRGFGVGKWNGVGGKQDPGEDIVDTAIRESQEEINVTPLEPKKIAVLNYHFPSQVNWGQQVHIFIVTKWQGEPVETEEMRPKWFNLNDIPYDQMWSDDKVWMPKALKGKMLTGSFMFDNEGNITDYYIDEVDSVE